MGKFKDREVKKSAQSYPFKMAELCFVSSQCDPRVQLLVKHHSTAVASAHQPRPRKVLETASMWSSLEKSRCFFERSKEIFLRLVASIFSKYSALQFFLKETKRDGEGRMITTVFYASHKQILVYRYPVTLKKRRCYPSATHWPKHLAN